MLNEMFHENASKFTMFHVQKKNPSILVFFFISWNITFPHMNAYLVFT